VEQLLDIQPAQRLLGRGSDHASGSDGGGGRPVTTAVSEAEGGDGDERWARVRGHAWFVEGGAGAVSSWDAEELFRRSPPVLGEGLVSAATAASRNWGR
jgi:hypothetical protein